MKSKRLFNFNLQRHADKDTSNNDLGARRYQKQFRDILEAVFQKRAYFGDFFGGGIEALDGVQDNENAFYVKTSDIPVVIGNYDTGKDVGFGSGTSSSNRFGDRKEIIYTETAVPYTWDYAFHEGLDRFTVNIDMDEAIADRLDLQAQARMAQFNKKHGKFISDSAGETKDLGSMNADDVLELFNELSAYFTNMEAIGTLTAKVTPELYNVIVDHPIATTGKHSSANIDDNKILRFKGFEIEEVPETMFQEDEVAYAYVKNVGKAFTGIITARTIESEDFDGVALQGAGKAGEFILEDNKKAVVKVEEIGD